MKKQMPLFKVVGTTSEGNIFNYYTLLYFDYNMSFRIFPRQSYGIIKQDQVDCCLCD